MWKTIMIALCTCAILLVIQFFLAIGAEYLTLLFPQLFADGIGAILLDMAVYILGIIPPAVIGMLLFKFINKRNAFVGQKTKSIRKPAIYIIGSVGAGYAVNLIVSLIFYSFVEEYSVDIAMLATTIPEIILMYVMFAVLPAICEEWAFRGVLLKNLLPFGRHGAVLISSLLFGIVHVDPPRIIFASVFGMALGYCYEQTGSLKLSMLIHFINNAISVTVTLFADNLFITLIIGNFIYASIGLAIFGMIHYIRNGVSPYRVSLKRSGKWEFGIPTFIKKFVLNPGMLPLLCVYVFYFYLYYLA